MISLVLPICKFMTGISNLVLIMLIMILYMYACVYFLFVIISG